MQKGFARLLLILTAVVFIAGLVYIFKNRLNPQGPQTPLEKSTGSEDNTFMTYASLESNFVFTYSKDLIVKQDTEEEFNKRGNGDYRKNFKGYVGYEPAKPLNAVVVLDKDENYETNPFSVWVFENSANLSVDKWFEAYWYYPFMWGVFDYTSKNHIALDSEATVSGQPAKSKIVSYQPGKPKFIYVSKDQKMYLLRVIGEKGEKILLIFKFID